MKNSIFIVVTIALLASTTNAQNISSSSDSVNIKEYGNCVVHDSIDMFTDEITYILTCNESTFTDESAILFLATPEFLAISLSKGIQFHLEDEIEIAVRVDRHELRTGTWSHTGSGNATLYAGTAEMIENTFPGSNLARPQIDFITELASNKSIFVELLAEVASGERIAIRVGSESGNLMLEGAYEAVADYIVRIEHLLSPDERIILPIKENP